MFLLRNRRSGNIYTFVSIVLILVMISVIRITSPEKKTEYPEIVRYNGMSYRYSETISSISFRFARKRPVSEEGYIILARRGVSVEEEVYIYEGFRRYRKYVRIRE